MKKTNPFVIFVLASAVLLLLASCTSPEDKQRQEDLKELKKVLYEREKEKTVIPKLREELEQHIIVDSQLQLTQFHLENKSNKDYLQTPLPTETPNIDSKLNAVVDGAFAAENSKELFESGQKEPEAFGIDNAGVEFIKKWEGYHECSYWDFGGYSVGWGTRGEAGKCITKEQAHNGLMEQVNGCNKHVNNLIDVPLNQNEFNALVSFCYNMGRDSLESSDLRKRLNKGEYDSVPDEFNRWVYADKKLLGGLVNRRKAEGKLFTAKL